MAFTKKQAIYISIAAIILILFALFLYSSESTKQNGEIPFIKADKNPVKIKPEEGSDITASKYDPIYDQIKSQKYNTSSAVLAPPPEEPIIIESNGDDNITQIVSNNIAKEPEIIEKKSVQKKLVIVDIASDNNSNTKIQKRNPQIYAQVASSRNKEDAEKEFRRISKNHPKILKGLGYRIEKFDIKNKGRYYKLLVGPLENAGKAQLVCKKLIGSGISCIIKRI